MFIDLIASLTSPAAYRRFAGEKLTRTAAYVMFLSLIFIVALSIAIKIRLTPLFDQTFDWLKTSMPAITFSDGKVTSTALSPIRVEHPSAKEVAVMIDTARVDPVTPAQMSEAKVIAYLTNNALYMERNGRLETFDMTKSASKKTTVIDAGSYAEMERLFNWIFYPLVLLFFFFVICASIGVFGTLYGLVGLLLASSVGAELGFGALLRLAIHAQSAALLLRAVETLLPVNIPFSWFLSVGMSVTYLTLGVRAAGRPEIAPTPPSAP